MVINTSQNTEGIHVWACSAAYVDPAASLRGQFSPDADWQIHNSLIDWNTGPQPETLKNGYTRPAMFYRGYRL